jgi:hypothetical protein
MTNNSKFKFFIILITCVFLIGWTKLNTTLPNNSGLIFFQENNTPIDSNGNEFWIIQDLYIEDNFGDTSSKSLVKYDCSKHGQKIILFSKYKTHMADGKPRHVFALDKPQWFYPKNDSQAFNIIDEICNSITE